MAPKSKDKDKVVSVKGDEAEDMVLKYLKKVNRPYASTDISANLKQAVSKAVAQKALLSLAQKGLLTQKDYGKQTVFVYPQEAAAGDTAESSLADLDAEIQALVEPLEEAKKRASKLQSEVNALKSTPTTDELEVEIEELNKTNATHLAHLEPLRAGAQPISPEDLKAADAIWTKERAEWVKRRKTFGRALDQLLPDMNKEQRREWEEEVGIEEESEEAKAVEAGRLCSFAAGVPAKVRGK